MKASTVLSLTSLKRKGYVSTDFTNIISNFDTRATILVGSSVFGLPTRILVIQQLLYFRLVDKSRNVLSQV